MTIRQPNSFRTGPDERGHFGIYGGRFVAVTLMPLILELEKAYAAAKNDPTFHKEMTGYLKDYVGRPSPLYFAERLTDHLGGAKIYLKREDLNHTGAHKVNNVLGQILLARRMGKPRVIAETGAGMHGVATATMCAKFRLQCIVYMGEVDIERQKPNVLRMRALGAEVRPVVSGSKTLKDAMNEALRDWVTNVADTFYCIGTVAGPHPYPMMVRDFQCIIGNETREQMMSAEGRLPDSLIACIGGGSTRWVVPSVPRRWQIEITASRPPAAGCPPACGLDRGEARRAARQPHLSLMTRTARSTSIRSRPVSTIPASVRSSLVNDQARAHFRRRTRGLAAPSLPQPKASFRRRPPTPFARDGSGAAQASGSPDGGEPLRARRQGSASVADYLERRDRSRQ
jgi:hypothetical protein